MTGTRWLQSAKPASWPKLLTPFALGQAIGVTAAGRVSLSAVLFGLAFTAFDALFIVWLNDWSDREVDALKRRMFPQAGGPKTIPDGLLPAHRVLFAGVGAGLGALLVAWLAQGTLDRPGLVLAAAGALGVFVAYSLPPLRLNYRGGGELLEMLGVGVVLPWLQVYLQGGRWSGASGLALLPGLTSLALASAIASGLSDERSDRAGGKRTFVTTFGNPAARRAVEALVLLGALAWGVAGWLAPSLPTWIGVGAAAVVLVHTLDLLRLSGAAGTDAFAAQRRYKGRLHQAIWRGTTAAAVSLLVSATWLGAR